MIKICKAFFVTGAQSWTYQRWYQVSCAHHKVPLCHTGKIFPTNSNWSVTSIRGQTCSQSFICKYFRLQPLSSTDINIPQRNSQRWKDENTFTFQQNSSKPPCNYLLPINPAENWCMVETANPQLTSDEKLTIPMILLKTFARKPKNFLSWPSLLHLPPWLLLPGYSTSPLPPAGLQGIRGWEGTSILMINTG